MIPDSKYFQSYILKNKICFFICLGLVLLNGIIYLQTYQFDAALPEEALLVKYFNSAPQWDNFKLILTKFPYPLPAPLLVCFLNSKFFGEQFGPRHMVNLFFHICISLMLFFTFSRATREIYKSGFIAALYAVHPLNVQTVAWISLHDAILSMFFSVAALLAYTYYVNAPDRKKFTLVFILYLLALMSNYRIIMLPLLFVIFDYWPLKRLSLRHQNMSFSGSPAKICKGNISLWHSLKEKVPFLLLSCFWVLIVSIYYKYSIYYFQGNDYYHGINAIKKISAVPLQWLNLFTAYIGYVAKLFFPVGLISDHCLDVYANVSLSFWKLFGSIIILVTVSYFFLKKARQGDRFYLAGWLWFLVIMLPPVLVNSSRQNLITDHYAALGSIGIFVVFTWGLSRLVQSSHFKTIFCIITGSLLIIVLTCLSYMQTQHWRDEISLFKHAVNVIPANPVPHRILGDLYLQSGKLKLALDSYQQSIYFGSDDGDIYNRIGVIYLRQGKKAEALRSFNKAIELMPENITAYHNKAIINSDRDIQVKPYYFINTSDMIVMNKPTNQAIKEVYKALARSFLLQDKPGKALQAYQQALKMGPADADIFNKIGDVYLYQNDRKEAVRFFLKAIEAGPGYGYAMAHHNIGNILIDSGEIDKAIVYLQKAIQIEPYFFKTHNSLAIAFLHKQQPDKAIMHLQTALDINPNYTTAQKNLDSVKKHFSR